MKQLVALALLAVASIGCAARVTVRATGVVDPKSKDRLVPGASIAVVVNPEAESAPLHQELAAKIEGKLRSDGYEIKPAAEASVLVFFEFGTRRSKNTEDPRLVTTQREPNRGLKPDTLDHYFRITALDAEPYRKESTALALWTGEAVLAEGHLRNPGRSDEQALVILDLLRDGALESFGQDQKRMSIGHFIPDSSRQSESP